MRILTEKLLRKLNLSCRKISSTYPTHICLNEIESVFEIEPYLFKKNVLLKNIPLKELRGLPFLKWGKESNHPFAIAVRRALIASPNQGFSIIKQTLDTFYRTVAPLTITSLVQANNKSQLPAWAVIMPWETGTIDQWVAMIKQSVIRENRLCGINVDISHGWAWLGPVSETKLEIESRRLYKTMQSILNTGYQRSDLPDGDIYGDLLVDAGGNWVVQTVGGQHRAASLSGLSFDKADVRVRSIIKAEHAQHWPQVRAGLYTVEQALNIFNVVTSGQLPQAYKAWASSL